VRLPGRRQQPLLLLAPRLVLVALGGS